MGEAFILHLLGVVASLEHLAHHGEIVCFIGLKTDLETAVLTLIGLAVHEHHHRSDRMLAMNSGDIKALDAQGRPIERERAFELEQCCIDALIVIVAACFVAHEHMARVCVRHLQERRTLPPLGNDEVHLGTIGARKLFGEPLFDDRAVFGEHFKDDLVRDR